MACQKCTKRMSFFDQFYLWLAHCNTLRQNIWQLLLIRFYSFCSNNCIEDSFTFAKEMQDLQLHPKETFLFSFDICSLFTSVPLAETIQICADSLYGGELIRPDYSKEIFLELMNTATKSVEFSFTVTTTYKSKLMAWQWVVH